MTQETDAAQRPASPLLNRLIDDLGWRFVTSLEGLDAWLAKPGEHCVFIPGDPAKNLETNDAAVILPEGYRIFQGRFDVALIADGIERVARERFDVWPTPSLIFVRDGAAIGAIPKVRDWDDYLRRVSDILDGRAVATA